MKTIEEIAKTYVSSDEHRVQLKFDEIRKHLEANYKHMPIEWYGIEALRRTDIYFKASYTNMERK